ncbi:MAG: dihydrodipicolinate synthase family protein, partial [Armatimonadetes bacterium]|nr:dihydrodipicolinate synthase family protein [Armatimonadota bacterium]
VVGQCNHTGAVHAAELARKAEAAGADLVAVALPHLFPTSDEDLARYAQTVCDAVKVPVMLQDFNPGGYTVGADFCAKLSERCDNFRYIKLEEPRMGPKMLAIHQATGGKVGVLEGWGGLYMPELVPQGCIGSVPGFVLSDLLVRIFDLLKAGDKVAAFEIFCEVVPFINFSLENFELYHHAEKQLLVQRGVLKSAHVRDLTTHLDPGGETYLAFLAERLWATLDRFGFARCPLAG